MRCSKKEPNSSPFLSCLQLSLLSSSQSRSGKSRSRYVTKLRASKCGVQRWSQVKFNTTQCKDTPVFVSCWFQKRNYYASRLSLWHRCASSRERPQRSKRISPINLIALDGEKRMESASVKQILKGQSKEQCLPEVALVDFEGRVVYHVYCRPEYLPPAKKWLGGVKYDHLEKAAVLSSLVGELAANISGKSLVGHGLRQDLVALGIQHPPSLVRDTVNYSKFQRKDGTTLSLKKLVKTWLGVDIQPNSKPHSAREDAKAVMELYKRYILTDPSQLCEQEMLDGYLSGLLKDEL